VPHRDKLTAYLLGQPAELGGAIVFAVVLPFLLRFQWDFSSHWDHWHFLGHWPALLTLAAGVVLTHILTRQISAYPGADAVSSVLPPATLSFALVTVVIAAGHLDYARSLLLAGYIATIVWYVGFRALRARLTVPRLALISMGKSTGLMGVGAVDWVKVTSPGDVELARRCDGIVLDLGAELSGDWRAFLAACASAGVPIYDSSKTRELLTGQVELSRAADLGLDVLLPKRGYIAAKSAIDFVAAVSLLPVALPILALCAVAIKLDSPGPAFFVQERVGFRGRKFGCIKLRTMCVDADRGPSYTREGDARVTRVGRLLRRSRADELPQIFNILRGQMSWIGPRPEASPLAAEYERHIPYYAFRHAVRPGISGWAAVRQGNVAEVEAATSKLKYDFYYIKNLSASLDALIACRTVWIVLMGYGSR
jgi:lipopolysaccharide/colanic/teichoic acid biosynthesis glycosyltransferase